ncbi:FtsQ-type POTRA domain-containing protein [Candidatus Dojkabacteria bacterium]|nr:FtsQ-type POTRA domain-containing protein [Candidatus Dojkabacteria bacterium]
MKLFFRNKNSRQRSSLKTPSRQKFKRARQKRSGRIGIGLFRKKSQPRKSSYKRRYSFIFAGFNYIFKRIGTIAAVGFVISLVVVFRLIINTDYFDVKEIHVIGVEKTDQTKFEEIARNYKGKNIYSVDLNKLEKDVSAVSIYIKDVYAKKYLPDRIEITIKERYPSFVILNYDGIYLVDEEYIVTNIPFKQEIGFSQAELDAYTKNDIESDIIKEKIFAKIKAGELELELQGILAETSKFKTGQAEDLEEIKIEDIDFAKIDQKIKLEELDALKSEINGITAEHFASLEQIVNESEYAGLRRIYFDKNGNYEEGQVVEEGRLVIYDKVDDYFADNEDLTIAKSTWTSDYTLRVDFLEKKTILFASNREIERQLDDLEVVMEELRSSGKDFKRIDLRTETIGVK